MKTKFLAIGALMLGMFASCSNDLNTEPAGGNTPSANGLFSPVKTPDVKAWSGTQSLDNLAFSSRAEEGIAAPALITEEEVDKVINILKCYDYRFERINNRDVYYNPSQAGSIAAHTLTEIEKISDWDILSGWSDYFVQEIANSNPLTSLEAQILSSDFKNDDKIENLAIWSKEVDRFTITPEEYNNSTDKATILDSQELINKYQKIENHKIVDISYNTFNKRTFTVMGTEYNSGSLYASYKVLTLNNKTDEAYIIIYYVDGNTGGYVPGTNDQPHNGYWNRIIKLTNITADKPEVTPSSPNDKLVSRLAPTFKLCPVDECGHPVHEGPCPECQDKDIDCTVKSTPNFQSEVEVNLSILDNHPKYDVVDLVTKLSIHVRYPRDVEVILPVPTSIYCDQDDLYILKDHYFTEGENGVKNPNWVYGGEKHTITYPNMDGKNENHNVTLTVEFVAPDFDNITTEKTGFIRVYTEGINEDVIEYLYREFGDGVNFEIFNYYNRGNMYTTGQYPEINAAKLQGYLDHSMINFDSSTQSMVKKQYPAFYINAFNELDKDQLTGDGNKNEFDCYVWIFGDDRADHKDFYKDDEPYRFSQDLWTKWWSVNDDEKEDPNYTDEIERSFFWNAYKGVHYNSSKYNWIYTHKGVKGSVQPGIDINGLEAMEEEFPFE